MNTELLEQKWVEIAPYGLVGGMAPDLSLMVFKEKKGEKRFAVWLSQLQSQIALEQGLRKEETFSFLSSFFRSVNIYPKKCYFVKNKNGEQLVRVQFDGDKKVSTVLRADESLAFCIYHNCRFFCTLEFMESMRHIKMGRHINKIKREPPVYLN